MAAVQMRTSGWMPRKRSIAGGTVMRQTNLMSLAPRSFTRSTAATAVLPVAITGEMTMTWRSAISIGALKKYSTATSVSGSR